MYKMYSSGAQLCKLTLVGWLEGCCVGLDVGEDVGSGVVGAEVGRPRHAQGVGLFVGCICKKEHMNVKRTYMNNSKCKVIILLPSRVFH